MATTTYVYRAQRIAGYCHEAFFSEGGANYQRITRKPKLRRCRCGAGGDELSPSGWFEREFRALPSGRIPYFIVLRGRIFECARCGGRRREKVHFADGQRRFTRAFGRYVGELVDIMTVDDVAHLLGVGWDLVKDLHAENLAKKYPPRGESLSLVRYVGIDEFAIRKGHNYMTVVVDLETGRVLHAVEGKDAHAVIPFLLELRLRANVEAIVTDMSAAFINAIEVVFGGTVDHIHDRYHVVALVNRAIDETRRDIQRSLGFDQRKMLKGSRFVLLRGNERLSSDQADILEELMAINRPLSTAYVLKEQLRMLWEFPDLLDPTIGFTPDEPLPPPERIAGLYLDRWLRMARASKLRHFVRLADTLDSRRKAILNYFRHRLTNGRVEGLNNKIKVLKRQAYGYRDMEYFKLRLYDLHNNSIKLN